jgi:lipopolysaccharide/colanic/teichoic acid biosynthesis glycosyltransferase
MAHFSEFGTEFRDDFASSYFKKSDDAARGRLSLKLYRRHLKRVFDITAVVLSAPFVLPLILVLAILIKRDGASAFYSQDRVGMNGRTFRLWKLRSMVTDADQHLKTFLAENPEARAEWQETQKLKNDPRITKIGRLIRKTSLDELPQLWNVLNGSMSLVGPRPMMPNQVQIYPGRAYYALRPGLTGFWQISSRNEASFATRATFDTRYARRLSFATDLLVLFATIRVVLRGTGY